MTTRLPPDLFHRRAHVRLPFADKLLSDLIGPDEKKQLWSELEECFKTPLLKVNIKAGPVHKSDGGQTALPSSRQV